MFNFFKKNHPEQAKPSEPLKAAEPARPSEPPKATEPARPSEPPESSQPARPSEPQKPKEMDADAIRFDLLNGGLSKIIELKSETRDGSIYLPQLKMSILPVVHEVRNNFVNLGFRMYSEIWETQMYECCVGLGSDTNTAYGMAVGSFAFSFMKGLKNIADNNAAYTVSSEFAGKPHNWKVYKSDIVGMGNKNESHGTSEYWELIRDDIVKRLGNQKITYVKIFASKYNSSITGECRINDIPVPELGKKVGTIAEKWDTQGFKSEKQFFFIIQDDDTIISYPYTGRQGKEKIKSAVTEYLKIFSNIRSNEEYNRIVDDTSKITGDRTLAIECNRFISEIFAEKVFEENISCGDVMQIARPDGSITEVYKSQLSDYKMISESAFEIFASKLLGDQTENTFGKLAALSSLNGVMKQVKEKGGPQKGLTVSYMLFNVDDQFEIR